MVDDGGATPGSCKEREGERLKERKRFWEGEREKERDKLVRGRTVAAGVPVE